MNEPKTLFITGATGLVGSHAVEEALPPRVPRQGPGPRVERHPMARRPGGREGRRRPRRRRGPPPGGRGGRLGLQLRGEGGRLGNPGGVPPAQRRGPPAPARRGERREGRAVRPRQLAGRLRGARPFRDRRDDPAGRRGARRLHPVEGRGRGPGPAVRQGAGPAAVGRPARVHLRRARPDRPAQAAPLAPDRPIRLLRLGRPGAQLHLRQEPGRTRSSSPPRSPAPSARSSTSPTAPGSARSSSSAGSPSWPA